MGEWVLGTIIGDYSGTTIGMHPPFPTKHQGFEGPGRFQMKACGVQMLPHFFNAVSDI